MGVLLLTRDLMFGSRVRAAAERMGRSLALAGSCHEALARVPEEASPLHLVMIDLELPELDLAPFLDQLLRHCEARPAIVAYGPHVLDSLLKQASEAGVDQVMSKGQFYRDVTRLLTEGEPGDPNQSPPKP